MDSITKYFELATKEEFAHLFQQSDMLPLVLDENEMRFFAKSTGKTMGVVFDNSPFYMIVADLVGRKQNYFRYARVLYSNVESNGTVAIPYFNTDHEKYFGILTHYRHAPREFFLEFPRGFCEEGLTPEENILKELSEELGMEEEDLIESCNIEYLGDIRADTGLSAGKAECFLAEIRLDAKILVQKKEGISKYEWVSEKTFQKFILDRKITDGFTLASYTLFNCWQKQKTLPLC